MALDKEDQMAGGKTAAGAKSAAASGKMGASSSQSGATKRDTSGTGLGGLLGRDDRAPSTKTSGNYTSGRSTASLDAQAKAVSRGSGLLGSINSTKPADQKRALTSVGLAFGDRYGLPGNSGIGAISEMAKTLAGEVGKYGQPDYDAAARTMTNRMDMIGAGYTGFGQTVKDMLGAYDANRYTPRTQIPATMGAYGGYKAAKPGTASFQKGMTALANAMSPYSEVAKTPAVAKATHYYSGPQAKAYQAGFQQYGPHKFGRPDIPGNVMAQAQQRALAAPGLAAAATQPKTQDRLSPNMNMVGYQSPMTGLSGMPQAPSASRVPGMAQYGLSPVQGGIAAAQDATNPDYALTGAPDPFGATAGLFGSTEEDARARGKEEDTKGERQIAAMMNGLPGLMDAIRATPPSTNIQDLRKNPFGNQSPNMNMAGYDSPMAGVGGMPSPKMQDRLSPERQQSLASQGPGLMASPNMDLGRSTPSMNMAGYNSPMAGVGSLPANPQSAGMSFNPGMPRNPVSGMAFNPGMPRNQTGGMSFTPGMPGEMPQQVAQGIPGQVGREAYDPLGSIRAPQVSPPQVAQQGGGFFSGLGEAVKNAGGLVSDAVESAAPLAKTAWDNINHPMLQFAAGLSRPNSRPNNPMRDIAGGQPMWTGNEPPQLVAQMQQRVEEILRQYLGAAPAGVA